MTEEKKQLFLQIVGKIKKAKELKTSNLNLHD
jgi:hypothetical protein